MSLICGALIIMTMAGAPAADPLPLFPLSITNAVDGMGSQGASYRTAVAAHTSAAESQPSEKDARSDKRQTRVPLSPDEGSVGKLVRERGLAAALFAIFIAGIGLTLTPCVFPMIPVLVGWFAVQGAGKKSRVALMAAIFLVGLAATYSALGLSAANAGGMLGATLQHPIALITIAAIFLALALSMFGVFEIRPPAFIANRSGGRQGPIGMLLMGALFGIVAAPCAGPVVAGLLIYVGQLGKPVIGFWMLFTLALGLGLPFFVLAIFSGALASLPKAGMWMVAVRHVFGLVLVYFALRYLGPIIPRVLFLYLLAAFFLGAGAYICCIEKSLSAGRSARWLRPLLGIAIAAVGMAIIIPQIQEAAGRRGRTISDIPYSPAILDEARKAGVPVVLHFSADWCSPCKKLAAVTFADPDIAAEGSRFRWVKADLTTVDTPEKQALVRQYGIKGVPTVVLIGSDGLEKKRFVGFVDSQALLKLLKQVR